MGPHERRSPYKGLLPFDDEDHGYFFGRADDSERIVASLLTWPLSALYAESGVGKTSVLLAGVVPQLRAEWHEVVPVVFRTWQDPGTCLRELKAAIAAAVAERHGGATPPEESPLDELLIWAGAAAGGEIALILDQFEEFFLYSPSSRGEHPFEAEFTRSVNRRDVPAHVLLSLREDSLAGLDRFRGRIPNLFANTLRLEHLDAGSARAAIRKPLHKFSEEFGETVDADPDLVERLIVDLGAEHAAGRIETPQLQLILERLWKAEWGGQPRSHLLRLATYTGLGGRKAIVGSHLQEVLDRLRIRDPGGWRACGKFFKGLVTRSGSKYALTPDELREFAEDEADHVAGVLEPLRAEGVLQRVAHPDIPDLYRYEIAHDTLGPAVWEWLGLYAAEDLKQAQAVKLARAEADAAVQRQRAEQQEQIARKLRQRTWAISALLLAASVLVVIALIARRRAEDLATKLNTINGQLEQQKQAEVSARKASDTAKDVAIKAENLASEIAKREMVTRQDAQVRRVLAEAGAKAGNQVDLSLLLSLAARRLDEQKQNDPAIGMSHDLETSGSLLASLTSAPYIDCYHFAHKSPIRGVAYQPNGGRFAVSCGEAGELLLWDTAQNGWSFNRITTSNIEGGDADFRAVAFHPKDDRFATIGKTKVILWSPVSVKPSPRALDAPPGLGRPLCLAFNPDGTRLAVGFESGWVVTWSIGQAQGPAEKPFAHENRSAVRALAFRDADSVAVGDETGRIALFNTTTREVEWATSVRQYRIWSVAIDRERHRLAAGSEDRDVRVWDLDQPGQKQEPHRFGGHEGMVLAVRFDPKGRRLASAGKDGSVLVWDLARSGAPRRLAGHHREVVALDFDSSGDRLISGGNDCVMISWKDLDDPHPLGEVFTRRRDDAGRSDIEEMAYSPDGRWLAACDIQGAVRVWDTGRREAPRDLPLGKKPEPLFALAFDPADGLLAAGGDDRVVHLWEPGAWTARPTTIPTSAWVREVRFTRDGQTLAVAELGGIIEIFRVDREGQPPRHKVSRDGVLTHDSGADVWSLAFSPDSKFMVSGDADGSILRWHQHLGAWTKVPVTPGDGSAKAHESLVLSLAFSPDSRTLASGSYDSTIRLWDTAKWLARGEPLRGHVDTVEALAFSPDGRTLASAGLDAHVWLWDVASARSFGLPFRGPRGRLWSVAFVPEAIAQGRPRVASGGEDGRIMLWDVAYERWEARAGEIAPRNLTKEEFQRYLGKD